MFLFLLTATLYLLAAFSILLITVLPVVAQKMGRRMNAFGTDDLDPVIHGKLRLGVMAYLASAGSASFTTLCEKTGATDGNLSSHLQKLEEAGYVKIDKRFENRKPLTVVSLVKPGRRAWIDYLEKMQVLLGFGGYFVPGGEMSRLAARKNSQFPERIDKYQGAVGGSGAG